VEPDRQDEIIDWLGDRCKLGDLLLIGGHDVASRAIQMLTNSEFSHAAVVTGTQAVTEAYDFELTLSDEDEGVYETDFRDLVTRDPALARIAIYRMTHPVLDTELLVWTAAALRGNTPTYPTTAALLFLGGQIVRRVGSGGLITRPRPSRRAVLRHLGYWADGPRRVQCAELATRLFSAAGAHLDFRAPLMSAYIDELTSPGDYIADDLIPLPTLNTGPARRRLWVPPRVIGGGRRLIHRAATGVTDLSNTLANRALHRYQADLADYALPPDLANAEPLARVALIEIDSHGTIASFGTTTDR